MSEFDNTDMPDLRSSELLLWPKKSKLWLSCFSFRRSRTFSIRNICALLTIFFSVILLGSTLLLLVIGVTKYAFFRIDNMGMTDDLKKIIQKQDRLYASEKMLIDTEVCQLKAHPLWYNEITDLYRSHFNLNYPCKARPERSVNIRRFNFSQIIIDELEPNGEQSTVWQCVANNIRMTNELSFYLIRAKPIEMGYITDFKQVKWTSVFVKCEHLPSKATYNEVVLLIHDFINPSTKFTMKDLLDENYQSKSIRYNVMLLGLDSVSRLNSIRHLRLLNDFYQQHDFIDLLGYHKVGENTFPNMIPLLTGKTSTELYNDDTPANFTWDNSPLIFKEYREHGYTTTFIEDMAPYGLFSRRGGFRKKPADYFIRPGQMAMWAELTNGAVCYRGKVENQIYWDYFVDLMKYFEIRPHSKHFSYFHVSTLTHDEFNYAGYADRPYYEFFKSLFTNKGIRNTVIFSFSDHSARFGTAVDTDSNVHESRLPFMNIYIPDSFTLDGRNATELRRILYSNRHKLTSHYDVHATLKHILHGNPNTGDKFGLSLLTPIPNNRTCEDAGIGPEYCLCNTYTKLALPKDIENATAQHVIDYINNDILSDLETLCAKHVLWSVKRVFQSIDARTGLHRWLIVFETSPSYALFEAIIDLKNKPKQGGKPLLGNVINVSRQSRFSQQIDCLMNDIRFEPYCHCLS